jgi:hypothetical protein
MVNKVMYMNIMNFRKLFLKMLVINKNKVIENKDIKLLIMQ